MKDNDSGLGYYTVSTLTFGILTGFVIRHIIAIYYNERITNDGKDLWSTAEPQQQQHRASPTNVPAPRRYGAAIRLRPDHYLRYRELHDKVWMDVLQRMYQSNIRNFTIYYHEETNTLYQHFEWIGHWPLTKNQTEKEAFDADMDAIANDPITKLWWKECEPCQEPFQKQFWEQSTALLPSEGGKGPWWTPLECVSHCGYWPIQYSNQPYDPDFVTMGHSK